MLLCRSKLQRVAVEATAGKLLAAYASAGTPDGRWTQPAPAEPPPAPGAAQPVTTAPSANTAATWQMLSDVDGHRCLDPRGSIVRHYACVYDRDQDTIHLVMQVRLVALERRQRAAAGPLCSALLCCCSGPWEAPAQHAPTCNSHPGIFRRAGWQSTTQLLT